MRKLKRNDETQELMNEISSLKTELTDVGELAAFLCKHDKNHIEHNVMWRNNLYNPNEIVGATVKSRFVFKNKIKEISVEINGNIKEETIETISNTDADYIIKVGSVYCKVVKETGIYMDVTEFFNKTNIHRIKGGCLGLVTEEREENE